jgi:hypothetical protein
MLDKHRFASQTGLRQRREFQEESIVNPQSSPSMQKRAFQALNQDGLLEILAGITFFICSAFVVNTSLIFLLFIPVFIFGPALRWLQQRFIYPRIGYATLPKDNAHEGRGILVFAMAAFVIYVLALVGFGVLRDVSYWRQWAPALAGALCCGGFLFLGSRSGLARHYLFIGASLAGGFTFSMIELDRPYESVQMFLLAMAALMVVSGSLIFIRFIRTHHLAPAGSAVKEVNEHS